VSGEGRGCNELTGSFTVTQAVYGGSDSSYLQDFEATFEQHCEGAEPAMPGHHQHPQPAGPRAAGTGAHGRRGRHRQPDHGPGHRPWDGQLHRAGHGRHQQDPDPGQEEDHPQRPLSTQVACTSGAPVSWQAVAIPNGTTPFDRGDAEVEVTASAQDPNFGGTVAVSQTQVVRLQKA
jgi:hypothetical protein